MFYRHASARIFLISIVLVTLTTGMLQAGTFSRSYGRPGIVTTGQTVQAADGGFYALGAHQDGGNDVDSFNWLWLSRLDSAGEIVWKKTLRSAPLGLSRYDFPIYTLAAAVDGGVAITTTGYGSPSSDWPWAVFKYNAAGVLEWSRVNASSGPNVLAGGTAILQTAAGGYLVTVSDDDQAQVILLNSVGATLWALRMTHGSDINSSTPTAAIETAAGEFIVAIGSIDNSIKGRNALVKLTNAGVVLWTYEYDDGSVNQLSGFFNGLAESASGDLYLSGTTADYGAGGDEAWILKLDSNAQLIWQKTVGTFREDQGVDVTATSDGGAVLAIRSENGGANTRDGLLLKFDGAGNLLWQNSYGEGDRDNFYSVAEAIDGSLFTGGSSDNFDSSGSQLWLQQLDSTGEFDQTCGLVTVTTLVPGNSAVARQVSARTMTVIGVTPVSDSYFEQDDGFGYSEHCPCTTCREDPFEWDRDDSCLGSIVAIHDGDIQSHTFWDDTDDWISFNACSGRSYTIETSALGASADTVLELYDGDCNTLLSSDDNGGTGSGSLLNWIAPGDGVYKIRVRQIGGSGAERDYDLALAGDTSTCSTWSKFYGELGIVERLRDLVLMPDGSLTAVGSIGPVAERDGWLLNLAPDGSRVWENTYGTLLDDRLLKIRLKEDSASLLLGGQTKSFGASGWDAWLLETDGSGTVAWSSIFNELGNQWVDSVQSDSRVIISGDWSSSGFPQDVSWEAWIDDLGALAGLREMQNRTENYQFPNQYGVGWVETSPGNRDLWDLDTGTLYGDIGNDEAVTVVEVPSGRFIVGVTDMVALNDEDIWVLYFNQWNELQWEKTFGSIAWTDRPVDAVATRNGNIVVAANSSGYIQLLEIAPDGSVPWQKFYGDSGNDEVTSLALTLGDGLLVSGFSNSFNMADDDGWVMSLSSEGWLESSCSLQGETGLPSTSQSSFLSSLTNSDNWLSRSMSPVAVGPVGQVSIESGQCFETCVDLDFDGSTVCGSDCDDGDPLTFPGANQICDGLNNDCSDPQWPTLTTDEKDADADGVMICEGDCNDSDINTYPNALEINDGLDNSCPGDVDYGLVDEISGTAVSQTVSGPATEICWSAQAGATSYQFSRSTDPNFLAGCDVYDSEQPCHTDSDIPPSGEMFYYLIRSMAPSTGSWGRDTNGVERVFTCGTETVCDDGFDNDGDLAIDCDDSDCVCPVMFSDTFGDDIGTTDLFDYFDALTVAPTDHLFFGFSTDLGNWEFCYERADFYRNAYLAFAAGGGTAESEGWTKWRRSPITGNVWTSWVAPSPVGFGLHCPGGQPYTFCAEVPAGVGGAFINPILTNQCELNVTDAGSCGNGSRTLTVIKAATRIQACGF